MCKLVLGFFYLCLGFFVCCRLGVVFWWWGGWFSLYGFWNNIRVIKVFWVIVGCIDSFLDDVCEWMFGIVWLGRKDKVDWSLDFSYFDIE